VQGRERKGGKGREGRQLGKSGEAVRVSSSTFLLLAKGREGELAEGGKKRKREGFRRRLTTVRESSDPSVEFSFRKVLWEGEEGDSEG